MASETHRWNVERDGGDLLICEGDHEKHEGCTYARYVPATTHQRTLEALREAAKALERFNRGGITLFGNEEDVPITFKGKDFQALRSALARIKEAT